MVINATRRGEGVGCVTYNNINMDRARCSGRVAVATLNEKGNNTKRQVGGERPCRENAHARLAFCRRWAGGCTGRERLWRLLGARAGVGDKLVRLPGGAARAARHADLDRSSSARQSE